MKRLYLTLIAVVLFQYLDLQAQLFNPKDVSSVGEMTAPLKLVQAVKEGDVNSVRDQIRYKANPSTIDLESGKPVLIIAIETGILNDKLNYADVAKVLIESGADVKATDAEGYTPLDYLYKTGAMGMRDFKREETRKEFFKRLNELLMSKGALNSEKYLKERRKIQVLRS